MITKPKFKDACDACGKFDYCIGHEGKVLCPECLPKEEPENGSED